MLNKAINAINFNVKDDRGDVERDKKEFIDCELQNVCVRIISIKDATKTEEFPLAGFTFEILDGEEMGKLFYCKYLLTQNMMWKTRNLYFSCGFFEETQLPDGSFEKIMQKVAIEELKGKTICIDIKRNAKGFLNSENERSPLDQ